MFELIEGVEIGIVREAGLPHFTEDLERALTKEREALAWDCRGCARFDNRGPLRERRVD